MVGGSIWRGLRVPARGSTWRFDSFDRVVDVLGAATEVVSGVSDTLLLSSYFSCTILSSYLYAVKGSSINRVKTKTIHRGFSASVLVDQARFAARVFSARAPTRLVNI